MMFRQAQSSAFRDPCRYARRPDLRLVALDHHNGAASDHRHAEGGHSDPSGRISLRSSATQHGCLHSPGRLLRARQRKSRILQRTATSRYGSAHSFEPYSSSLTVSTVSTSAQLPAPGAPPIFDLPPFDPIALAVQNLPSVQLATTVDCPSGNTLTFGSTAGISKGMAVFGPNIPPSTTVKLKAVATPTVTLSNNVTGDVPLGSVIAFGFGFSGTLNRSDLATAVQAVFPNDPAARKWLSQGSGRNLQLLPGCECRDGSDGASEPRESRILRGRGALSRGFRSASDVRSSPPRNSDKP